MIMTWAKRSSKRGLGAMSRTFFYLSIATLAALLMFSGCSQKSINIAQAVQDNQVGLVRDWLKAGGDPNQTNASGESLLYIATGPHGGNEVLEVLLAAGANVDKGASEYTPLMNAASWCNLEGVRLLLKHGANPKGALAVVGGAGGAEQPVIDLLRSATNATRSSSGR